MPRALGRSKMRGRSGPSVVRREREGEIVMSRVSSIAFGTVAAALLVGASGCRVSVETKSRYAEPNVVKEDSADWAGEPIEVNVQGVGISVNGGVRVTADPSAKRVKATARMLAMAFEGEKSNADLSLSEAKATFTVSRSGSGVSVACGHGGSHGSSSAGESGCELVEIVVPAGSTANPVSLTIASGSGTLTLALSGATIKTISATTSGADTSADLPATKGGSISLVSESGDIEARLPASFAADEVVLQADATSIALGPFTDIKNGVGQGGRGQKGTGLASLRITAEEFAGSTGKITLR
jgi:hypothetical protein